MNFGTLLRDWRSRRRYSQLDLALTANVSARHISFLETGRSNPSREMVLLLADALQLPRSDRNIWLGAAGFAPLYAKRDWASDELTFIRQAVDRMLENHSPYPGFALDRHWRLVTVNAAGQKLLGAVGFGLGDSLLDAITSKTALTNAIENLVDVQLHMRTRLRSESLYLGGDIILDSAVAKLEAALQMSAETPKPQPVIIPIIFRVGEQRLSLFTTLSHFGSTEDIALADMKIELMFPADAATQAALEI